MQDKQQYTYTPLRSSKPAYCLSLEDIKQYHPEHFKSLLKDLNTISNPHVIIYTLYIINIFIMNIKKAVMVAVMAILPITAMVNPVPANAFGNMFFKNNTGLETWTPVSIAKNKSFPITFRIVIDQETAENGYIIKPGIMDYRSVNWNITGCGINVNKYETDPAKIVGRYPAIDLEGLMPKTGDCTIVVQSSAMPCERGSNGICRNNDMLLPVYGKIQLTKKLNTVFVSGPSTVSKSAAAPQFSASLSTPNVKKTIWAWNARPCSVSSGGTWGQNLVSTFRPELKSTVAVGADCNAKVDLQVLTSTDGTNYQLQYLNGSKSFKVVK